MSHTLGNDGDFHIDTTTVLVEADAGDTIQLMFIPTVAGSSIGLRAGSIVVEQVTSG